METRVPCKVPMRRFDSDSCLVFSIVILAQVDTYRQTFQGTDLEADMFSVKIKHGMTEIEGAFASPSECADFVRLLNTPVADSPVHNNESEPIAGNGQIHKDNPTWPITDSEGKFTSRAGISQTEIAFENLRSLGRPATTREVCTKVWADPRFKSTSADQMTTVRSLLRHDPRVTRNSDNKWALTISESQDAPSRDQRVFADEDEDEIRERK